MSQVYNCPREADVIRAFFGAPPNAGNEPVISNTNSVTNRTQVVVFQTSAMTGVSGGVMINRKDEAGVIQRTSNLQSNRAIAFTVQDDSNPAYRTRDILGVNPAAPAIDGDDCLFVRDPDAAVIEGIVRNLVKKLDDGWIVKLAGQQEDRPNHKLNRAEFPQAWRIAVRHLRG